MSVRLPVTPFWQLFSHPIILKFSVVVTIDKSDVHAKGQGQRSKVKVTEVTNSFRIFRTLTPVWIHQWLENHEQSLKQLGRGALLFFKVISRSHGTKKLPIFTRTERFRTNAPTLIQWWLWNDAQSLKQHRRGALLFFKVIRQISRSHG